MKANFNQIATYVKNDALALAVKRGFNRAEYYRKLAESACALPPNTTDDLTESNEEREEFELMERRQRDPQTVDNRQAKINAMAEIARRCQTTSIEGICALLVDAGYGEVVKHG